MARDWAKGFQVINPPPSLSLFIMCKEFQCLPNTGGWYDQDPDICTAFEVISNVISEVEHDKAKQAKKRK